MDINAQGSRLATLRPGDANAAEVFTASINTEITRIVVCNVDPGSGAIPLMRIFHADSGDDYDEDTALYWDYPVQYTVEVLANAPNGGIHLEIGDELAVRSDTADGLVFHIYGVTASVAPGA